MTATWESGSLDIAVEAAAAQAICRLRGDLDAGSVPHVRTVLADQLDAERDAVVDLSGLRFIDSSGIGALVGAARRYQAAGHSLLLRDPSTSIRRVLEMTGVTGAGMVE